MKKLGPTFEYLFYKEEKMNLSETMRDYIFKLVQFPLWVIMDELKDSEL